MILGWKSANEVAGEHAGLLREIQSKDEEIRFLRQWIERLHTRNEQLTLAVLPLFTPRPPRPDGQLKESRTNNIDQIRHWPSYLQAHMRRADKEDNVSGRETKENGAPQGAEAQS